MENKQQVSTYRRILSSTTIFGGAQVLGTLFNVIRGKFVATILRSEGMGVSSVINNASNGLQQLSLMGLNVAAVPDISKANASEDAKILAATIRLVRRLVMAAAIIGVIITVALSPFISQLSFGTTDYTKYFLLLAAAVFFNVIGTGELTIMQGMRRYKLLAFCSIVPPLCGLLLSVPIYYIWGIEGIVPAMIVGSVVYFVIIKTLSYKDKRSRQEREHISLRTMWQRGSGIIKFGIVMTAGTLLGTLTTYALTVYISRLGSLNDVGFYQAASTITTQYVGLIFTAMAADYYPHLSGLIKTDVKEAFRLVNQQTEIISLIMTPIIMLLILSAPVAISILLTDEFLETGRMVRLLGMAGIFKALCFPMDYIAYAKSDTPFIFWVETVWGCAKTFTIMALSYYFMGLDGLGYGALITSIVDFIVCIVLIRWRYGFTLSKECLHLITFTTLLTAACLGASYIHGTIVKYSLMAILTTGGFIFCYKQLDQRMHLKGITTRLKAKIWKGGSHEA